MGRGRAQPFAQPEMCRDLPFRCGAKVLAITRVSTLLAAQAGAPGQASICRAGLFGVVIKKVLVVLISPSSINIRHGVTVNVAVGLRAIKTNNSFAGMLPKGAPNTCPCGYVAGAKRGAHVKAVSRTKHCGKDTATRCGAIRLMSGWRVPANQRAMVNNTSMAVSGVAG